MIHLFVSLLLRRERETKKGRLFYYPSCVIRFVLRGVAFTRQPGGGTKYGHVDILCALRSQSECVYYCTDRRKVRQTGAMLAGQGLSHLASILLEL